jgi:hypothetical protein
VLAECIGLRRWLLQSLTLVVLSSAAEAALIVLSLTLQLSRLQLKWRHWKEYDRVISQAHLDNMACIYRLRMLDMLPCLEVPDAFRIAPILMMGSLFK